MEKRFEDVRKNSFVELLKEAVRRYKQQQKNQIGEYNYGYGSITSQTLSAGC